MNSLKNYKFNELYEISSGISSKPEQAGHGFPFISFSTVFDNYFLPSSLPDLMDTSEKERITYSVREGDIFLTRTSETIDDLGMSCVAIKDMPNTTYSGFLKRLRPIQQDITYHKFMAFYLRSNLFRKTMKNNALMTLRASFNEQIFSYLDLILPEYKQQQKIGNFLYLLNKKIELNNKINIELETMAKLIYDYWFVQFDFPDVNGKPYKSSGGKMVYNDVLKREIPDGWEVHSISEKLTIGSGHSFSSDSYTKAGKYKVITIKNVQDHGLKTEKVDYVKKIPNNLDSFCILEIQDILISLTGNVGRLCLVNEEDLLLNQRVGKFLCDEVYKNYLYLTYLRPELRIWMERIATGSSQKNLSPIEAVKINCALPPPIILERFNTLINNNISLIVKNSIEIRELEELRDWLLPMLMNGQVKIN